ncbi:MAG TPA: Fe-S cluster assembly protein SufD [Burkholderiales bacterium]|nr:Fe-S cluster assembly protein SufD [Burkholderiales bacterium]
MSTATTAFLESLLAGHSAVPAGPLGWVSALRAVALERGNALTLPTTRDEDWRFTDLSALYKLAFKPAAAAAPPAAALDLFAAPEVAARLVFVDGRYAPTLSSVLVAAGISVRDLRAALAADGDFIRARLAALADFRDDAFRAINTACLSGGAFVHARRNAVADGPIQLLFLSTQPEVATHPRVLIVAEEGSDLTVLEEYAGLADGAYLVNGVTEIAVGPAARVRHVRVQREAAGAFHIATGAVRLERDATYASVSVALGARLSRHTLNVVQAGEGVTVNLDGLALIHERQLADTHSFIDHARPHGTSRQLHKCVVGDQAHAVFNGRILVREGAQLTNSAQSSRNLLLSRRAHVDTKPQLEIFADDVKCAHGAAIGQIEADELFYLRSRGLSETAARNLLTYGFAAEIVGRIPIASVAASLRRAVLEQTQSKETA